MMWQPEVNVSGWACESVREMVTNREATHIKITNYDQGQPANEKRGQIYQFEIKVKCL